MPPLAAMASGFMVTLGLIGLVTVGSTLSAAVPSPALDAAQSVNRSSKGDRLPGFTVDRQRPVQPKPAPVRTLQDDSRQRLEGCDPLVSPLAGSALSKVAGRCLAGLSARQKAA